MIRRYKIWKLKRAYWRYIDASAKAKLSEQAEPLVAALAVATVLETLGYRGFECRTEMVKRLKKFAHKERLTSKIRKQDAAAALTINTGGAKGFQFRGSIE